MSDKIKTVPLTEQWLAQFNAQQYKNLCEQGTQQPLIQLVEGVALKVERESWNGEIKPADIIRAGGYTTQVALASGDPIKANEAIVNFINHLQDAFGESHDADLLKLTLSAVQTALIS